MACTKSEVRSTKVKWAFFTYEIHPRSGKKVINSNKNAYAEKCHKNSAPISEDSIFATVWEISDTTIKNSRITYLENKAKDQNGKKQRRLNKIKIHFEKKVVKVQKV